MRSWIGSLLLLIALAGTGHAVVITTGDGTGNVTAPADDPGRDHVGAMGATGVYIGDGWVLTANHVAIRNIVLGGVFYDPIPGTEVQLTTDPSNLADLVLFRIADPPSLSPLKLAAAVPAPGEAVVMIGRGNNRAVDKTYWNPSWQEVPPPGFFAGWKQSAGRTIRWGTNTITEVNLDIVGAGALTREFAVEFDDLVDEGQAVAGDSGGAVFIKRGGEWELAGIMNFVQLFEDQPADTEVFGNDTFAVDLSFYRDQIIALTTPATLVPALPPWGMALLGIGLVVVGAALARRRRRV
jgi:hypothetical protein